MAEIHVGDVGTAFVLTVQDQAGNAKNLAAATLKQFLFQRPDGTVMTVAAAFGSDGTDGVLTYTTAAGDLDQAGTWRYEVYYEVGQGEKKHSTTGKFKVYSNIGG